MGNFTDGVFVYRDCVVENNMHEGAVAMNQAVVTMTSCHVRDNKAPGFEATHEGAFILDRCHVH